MAERWDLQLLDIDGHPIAVVEVKSSRDLSRDLATALRRNILAHGGMSAQFFLLVSQDVGYLWTSPSPEAMPSYEFPMKSLVSRYLPDWKQPERLRHTELELLLLRWLNDLSNVSYPSNEEPEKALEASGFLSAVRGARVALEEAA